MRDFTKCLRRIDPLSGGLLCLVAATGFSVIGIVGFMIYSAAFPEPAPVPKFAPGQMVRMKAFDIPGMVISTHCWSDYCSYDVRFAALQASIPNGGLFWNGGTVGLAPVSRVNLREFEIEAIETGKAK